MRSEFERFDLKIVTKGRKIILAKLVVQPTLSEKIKAALENDEKVAKIKDKIQKGEVKEFSWTWTNLFNSKNAFMYPKTRS